MNYKEFFKVMGIEEEKHEDKIMGRSPRFVGDKLRVMEMICVLLMSLPCYARSCNLTLV